MDRSQVWEIVRRVVEEFDDQHDLPSDVLILIHQELQKCNFDSCTTPQEVEELVQKVLDAWNVPLAT